MTGRVGERLAGLKRRLLLLSYDLLSGWGKKINPQKPLQLDQLTNSDSSR